MGLDAGLRPSRKPPVSTRLMRSDPLLRGLLACWLCQDGGGSRLRDSTGRYHGTITTGTVQWSGDDRFRGRALRRVTAGQPIAVSLPLLTRFTVEGWFRRDNVAGYGAVLTQGATKGFYTNTMSGGTYRMDYFESSSRLSTTAIAAGVWTHGIVAYDGTTLRFYLNGRLDGSHAATGLSFTPTLISGETAAAGNFLGNLSLLRVWNRALTLGEVRSLYQSPFRMFHAQHRRLIRGPVSSPGRTATVSVTQSQHTCSDTATVVSPAGGVVSVVQAHHILSAAATLPLPPSTITATLTVVQASHILHLVGTLALRGSLNRTQANQSIYGDGYGPPPPPPALGRHYTDQIMLGLFHAELPYDTPAASWPQAIAACSMVDFDDASPHEAWDDAVEDNRELIHHDEYPTVQEIVRQSVRFTYTEPRVKPNTLAGLLALALGTTPESTKDPAGNAWQHRLLPAATPFDLLSISAQIAHQQNTHWQYTGLKATNFSLKTNGPYLTLACELLGSGAREPVTSPWPPVVPEEWIPWGSCQLWIKDVSATPLVLPATPQQGFTNLGVGAVPISTRVLRMEFNHPNLLWGDGGYRPSTRMERGMLHASRRSTSLLLELEVDTAREASELAYYLTQARLAFEWQYVGKLIVPGGTYRYGATLILPCLQLQALSREDEGGSDTLVLRGQVLSDRVNPVVQAWVYTGQPRYLAVPSWRYTSIYTEPYEYLTTFVPWSGGTGGIREPMTEQWETPITAWGAPYSSQWNFSASGGDVGQVPAILGVGSLRQYRIGSTTRTLWLVPNHPKQSAGGFGARNCDMEMLLRLDDPVDVTPASGMHWTGLCWAAGSSGLSINLSNVWHFWLESPVNSGRVTRWLYGYMTNQSTFRANWVTVQEGTLDIPAGTVMGVRVVIRRQGSGTFPPFHNQIYFGIGTNLAALPLLIDHSSTLGDQEYPGGVFSYFTEYRSNLETSNTTTFIVNYDATSVRGYDVVSTGAWGTIWTGNTGTGETGGSGALYVLQDQLLYPPLAGQSSLLIRLNIEAPSTPRRQLFFHMKQVQNAAYEEGKLRALYQVRASAGSQPAYFGLYSLGRGTTNALNWASVGMLVEFNQPTNTYTRVLLVRWVNFATDFVLLAQAPFTAPMTQLIAMELEWHRTAGQPNLTLIARLGQHVTYSDLTTVVSLTFPNPYGFPARREGPVAVCYFDASPTAAFDLSLDNLALDHYTFGM